MRPQVVRGANELTLDPGLSDLANKTTECKVLHGIYQKWFIVYLKFSFNQPSWILLANPTWAWTMDRWVSKQQRLILKG